MLVGVFATDSVDSEHEKRFCFCVPRCPFTGSETLKRNRFTQEFSLKKGSQGWWAMTRVQQDLVLRLSLKRGPLEAIETRGVKGKVFSIWVFPKIGVKPPKMDGENNGKPH